jgi:hypothetical protein
MASSDLFRNEFSRDQSSRNDHRPASRSFGRLSPGPAPIASEALEHIAGLYAVEKDSRGCNADERRSVRHQKSRPLVDDLEPWLRAKLGLIQKSKLAKAIRYALSRWAGADFLQRLNEPGGHFLARARAPRLSRQGKNRHWEKQKE